MSTRTSSVGALMLLAACAQERGDEAVAAEAQADIECALYGAATFARECTIERGLDGDIPILVVRHPDGAFRRFEVADDGDALETADGAERAAILPREGGLEVTVGLDRYRIPLGSGDVGE